MDYQNEKGLIAATSNFVFVRSFLIDTNNIVPFKYLYSAKHNYKQKQLEHNTISQQRTSFSIYTLICKALERKKRPIIRLRRPSFNCIIIKIFGVSLVYTNMVGPIIFLYDNHILNCVSRLWCDKRIALRDLCCCHQDAVPISRIKHIYSYANIQIYKTHSEIPSVSHELPNSFFF